MAEKTKFQIEDPRFDGDEHHVKRSRHFQFLVILVILLLLCVIVLIILVSYLATTRDVDEKDVCLSPQCTKAAATVLNAIDFSVNPCDNFYDFACGGWIKRQTSTKWESVFGGLRDGVTVTLKYLLETEKESSDIEAIVKTKDLYQSCLNTSLIEDRGLSPIITMIEEFGGWPLLGNADGGHWNESAFDLSDLLVNVIRYYRVAILNFYVYADMKNSNENIMYLEQPSFGMAKKYIMGDINSTQMEAYKRLAESVTLAFGANESTVMADIDDFIALERDLANITESSYDKDVDELYNKYKVGELYKNFTESKKMNFSWINFIRGVFNLDGAKRTISENEPVIVKDPVYFEKMSEVLERYPKRTVANYVVWFIVKGRLWDLPDNIRVILNGYKATIYGFTSDPPRWKDCAKFVTNFLGHAIGRLFIEETFDKESKDAMTEMINNIRNAFKGSLDNLDWIDDSTKKVARVKSDMMQTKIGYEDFILNDKKLNRRYENYTIKPNTYFENVIGMLNLRSVQNLNLLGQKVDKDAWRTPPTRVNAYYSFELNRISFPAGILQPPYYHKDQPQSLNYGGIGFMIGHEITHGFDDVGRQYDQNGDVSHWWDKGAIRKFKERTKCFVEQYGNYSFPEAGGQKMDGKNTLGENIADNGGIKQCYMAYRQWVARNGKEESRLPGVNLTNDQLLFINIAQQRCTAMNEKSAIDSIVSDVHSPARFRIIGTMQNYKQFSKVFNCPVGSYMNPVDKCEIW